MSYRNSLNMEELGKLIKELKLKRKIIKISGMSKKKNINFKDN